MAKRIEIQLRNREFELNSRYSKQAMEIAKYSWSRFYGPEPTKLLLRRDFEVMCFCANEGLRFKL